MRRTIPTEMKPNIKTFEQPFESRRATERQGLSEKPWKFGAMEHKRERDYELKIGMLKKTLGPALNPNNVRPVSQRAGGSAEQ